MNKDNFGLIEGFGLKGNRSVLSFLLLLGLLVLSGLGLKGSHSLHTSFIKEDGSLWGAGNNSKGQLGDGTTSNRSSPVQALFGGVIAVSSGEYHTMFIKDDFTLWGIGQNGNGQLGDGSTTDRSTPVQISSNVHSVSCGYQHTIFLKRDGSLWGMGGNHIGQLGDATGNDHHSPVQIESSGVVFIAAGGYNTYYTKTNGSLWGSGYNLHGSIGNGTTTHVTTPYQIKPSGVKQVSAGSGHSAFLMTDGSLWTSGRNNYGQLGNGTTTNRQTHAQIIASGIKSISLGWYTTFIIKDDGSLWAAGLNSLGRLGDGTTTNRSTPVQIISSSVTQVSTGIEHSTVLKTDGSVWTFGKNSDGRLGIGNTSNASSPTEITGFNGVHRLADVVPNHLVELNSSVDLEMIWVQPGTFTMGSPDTEVGRNETRETEHNVTLTKGFYLGKYEVTQSQYEAVMTGNPEGLSASPSQFNGNPDRPVEKVSWNDIQVFLERLNQQENNDLPQGWAYVLPTEAQWEYACRAGTSTAYSLGGTMSASDANWDHGNDANQTQDVGSYASNPWGFFDMHGNVREWTAEFYKAFTSEAQIDPIGPPSGSYRVTRSGSWLREASRLRSADRGKLNPDFRGNYVGFRFALRQITEPPSDLNSTEPLTFAENQPIGTVIAEFNATDPEGGAITYHFVNGENNNTLFSLDQNGTLKTATVFDYESNATMFSIRVQARDDYNATVEGNFTVSLQDEPDTLRFGGFDGNGSTVTEVASNQKAIGLLPFVNPLGSDLNYTVSGQDASFFDLNTTSGLLTFNTHPSYFFPLDNDGDNNFSIIISVTNQMGDSLTTPISISVVEGNVTSWIFNHAGAEGRYGPTQEQVDLSYSNTNLAGKVTMIHQGIQEWSPSASGEYFVQAMGARGSIVSGNRGLGSLVGGKVYLQKDDNISIVVGQVGTSTAGPGGGGGGGSFFVVNGEPVIVAGGGGGHGGHKDSLGQGAHAPNSLNGKTISTNYPGGINGNGGSGAEAGGGGGFYSDGGDGSQATGGRSFLNGAVGGYKTAGTYGGDGGFGGGGGGKYKDGNLYGSLHDGGGGGGYSGGGGGLNSVGGGGGSLNAGSDTFLISGYNDDNGVVIITLLESEPEETDSFDPNPIGTIDLSDGQSLNNWIIGLSATGEIFYQEWNNPQTPEPVWALSIEVNPFGGGPEISQVVDMEGRVYNGDFGLYWEQTYQVQVDDDDPLFDNPEWSEVPYSADFGGIDQLINQQLADKFDSFNPTPNGTIDLSDPQGLKDWLAGLSATGEIFYQEWNNPQTPEPVWALSIEVDSAWAGPDISQVVDMDGRVYNGHFGLYWEQTYQVQVDNDDPWFDNPEWSEVPYSSDQVDLLFENHLDYLSAEPTNRPIVRTGEAKEVLSLGGYQLHGEVLTDGGSETVETGFWLGLRHRLSSMERIVGKRDESMFYQVVSNLKPGLTYYYRSYARNVVGETLGNLRKFKTTEAHDLNAWYAKMESLGHGWWSSNWLGAFSVHTNGWIYHTDLGWAYAVGDKQEGVWLWTRKRGWLWTAERAWPYLWQHNSASWLYLLRGSGQQGLFYDYTTGRYAK